ncbi:MAG: MarR family transcriptional regulator [Candidatus Omnitrophica bacterium]|nr:MarR family transcriptional regulator [Candidatus Omnitrophota bacterium]
MSLPLPEFADKVTELMHVIIKKSFRNRSANFHNLKITFPQMLVMNLVYKEGESNMTDLAHLLNVTTAAITGMIDRLVRDGYVTRVREPKDRRVVKVKLTTRGNNLLAKLNEHRRQSTIDIFSKISQEERDGYIKILQHICDHLE